MFKNVSVITPKWKLKPLQGSCQSDSDPMSQLISHYSWLLYPNSPTRQTGIIIVLGIYFAPFQPLGWGHAISSLVLPITPPWSFRDSGLPHILTKAPAQNHPPLSFQRIHDWAQILLLIMRCFFFYVVAVLVYIAKYATLTPDIIYSRGASAGDP